MPDPEKTEICEALQIAMTIVENRTSSFMTDRIEWGRDGNPYRMTITDGSEYYMPERVFTKDEVKKKEKAAYDKGYKDGYKAAQDEEHFTL